MASNDASTPLLDAAAGGEPGSVNSFAPGDASAKSRVQFDDSAKGGKAVPKLGDELVAYMSRWLMLALFCSATMTNAIIWITFAPISASVEEFYDVGTLAVNSLSMAFMVLYLPGSILSSYLLDRYGLRTGMVVGGAMGMVSCWIRYASVAPSYGGDWRYAILLFGQCLAALAQPIYTNAPAKLAGSWFPVKEREIATTIAAILNPVGNAVGSVVPALLVQVPNDMGTMLLAEAVFATVTFVPVAIWFKSQPPTAPSNSASQRHTLRRQILTDRGVDADNISSASRIRHEICIMLSDRNYVLLVCGFGMGLALFNAIITVIAQLIAPCGYTSTDAGAISGIIIGCGLFGAAVAGPLMEATKQYRPILKAGVLAASVGITVFLLALRRDNTTMLLVVAGVMGFCMMPVLPVVLENNAELTYPIPEETGAGVLLLVGQLLGVVFIVILDALIPMGHCTTVANPASILIWTGIGAAVLALGMYQGDYKRLKHEVSSSGKGELVLGADDDDDKA